MNVRWFPRRLWHFLNRFAILLLALVWTNLAVASEIHDAAKRGDLARVKELVKASPDSVLSRDAEGATPLLVAVKASHRDVVAFLITKKADVNTKGKDEPFSSDGLSGIKLGGTPLHCAAGDGDIEMLALLLTNKADVNIRDGIGETPLHQAVRVGKREATKVLLASRADVKALNNDGMTPLHEAIQYGRKYISEILLTNGADANAKDYQGRTPSHLVAIHHGDKGLLELLLTKGADVNARDNAGDTPLHTAAEFCAGDTSLAELLVAKGADVNTRNKNGDTPLSIPRNYSCPRLTELLQRHGGFDPRPMETNILRAAENGDVRAVKSLFAKDPTSAFREDENGNMPLSLAALYGLRDVAAVLAVNKAVVNATNCTGMTALHSAANGAMAELLVGKGADVNAKDEIGWTPLHYAARVCATDVAKVLVNHGADINATNNDAWTLCTGPPGMAVRKRWSSSWLTKPHSTAQMMREIRR